MAPALLEPAMDLTAAPVTNDAWLAALRSHGPAGDAAIEHLHELLLRAARHEVARRSAALSHVRGEDLEDVAMQAADDALVAVLSKLDDFRGASRFTTWAYKFALLEAGVRLRRRAWQHREVVLDSESWTRLGAASAGPAAGVERGELLEAISDLIAERLTPHQRKVLVALAIDGVPIDVLAERLASNRNALYKTLHDARRKLRAQLALQGLHPLEGGSR
jgi:RNA polymerase sigma-70 factor (ECF subfamily)